jgi:dTMP kinase
LIRAAFQEGSFPLEDKDRFDEQMAYLFAADRHYHLYNDRDGVWKRLDRERTHVISTRYYFSSLAYNCNTPEEFAFVRQLNGRFPAPDIVFHLDVSPDVSLERIRHRTVREIYEEREKLARVRANYRAIFKDYEGRCCRLDGGGTIEEVHRNVVEYLESSR